MKYNTPSLIVIPMKHIDHAHRLCEFLTRALLIADAGGDLTLAIMDGSRVSHKQSIGHDVRYRGVFHISDSPNCSPVSEGGNE